MNKGNQGRRYYEDPKSSKIDKKKLILIFAAVLVIAAIGLTVTLILRSCSKDDASQQPSSPAATQAPTSSILPTVAITGDPITGAEDVLGVWTLDGVTSYQFNNDDTGALITDAEDFFFYYSVEGNILYLEFADENVSGAEYACYLDGNTLYFDDTATQQTYILTKQ